MLQQSLTISKINKNSILIEIFFLLFLFARKRNISFFLAFTICNILFASTKVLIIRYVFNFCLLCNLIICNILNKRIFAINIAL